MVVSSVIWRLSKRLPSLSLKPKTTKSTLPNISPLKSRSQSQVSSSMNVKRMSPVSRLPVELSCLISMMPLHSAIASARLRSLLAVDSLSWCLIPQGISMPL